MNSPDEKSKLPMWIFFLTDAVLVAAAWFIFQESARPLSTATTFTIFACIFGGALIALVPLIAHIERQKNEVLDERQRELAAVARTVSASAEQIGIATQGLHELVEIAQKNVRQAEQVQHKLAEKIAEFRAQVSNAAETEREELEKELETLRASESERLEATASKIAKSAAEWARLEAATNEHLTAANEAVAKLSFGTASAIGKAQAAAEQALSQARVEAARTFGEASGNATKALEEAKAAALAEIAAKKGSAGPAAESGLRETAKPVPVVTDELAPPPRSPAEPAAAASTPVAEEIRKPTRPPKSLRSTEASTESIAPKVAIAAAREDGGTAIVAPEPPPVLTQRISEIAAVAPNTTDPFGSRSRAKVATVAEPIIPPNRTNGEHAGAPTPKPPRKRAPRTGMTADPLGLSLDDTNGGDASREEGVRSGVVERVLSSDGATRLLVTAYIGIGNRLFIRGDGPGLSWDKGVPLQFVSIGKWRWETSDATGTVKFKLFKNDDLECSSLGAQSVDPGQQQEVTAAF